MKSPLILLLSMLAIQIHSQKAYDIFTIEDLSKATFLKDADLQAFMKLKGFVLIPDSIGGATVYKYNIIPKSASAKPQTLFLKRKGTTTYLCSPQDAVMLSYVNFLESHIYTGTDNDYYTETLYIYKDINVAIQNYKKRSIGYGSYFIEIKYVSTNRR
jgi:hypothetical protein